MACSPRLLLRSIRSPMDRSFLRAHPSYALGAMSFRVQESLGLPCQLVCLEVERGHAFQELRQFVRELALRRFRAFGKVVSDIPVRGHYLPASDCCGLFRWVAYPLAETDSLSNRSVRFRDHDRGPLWGLLQVMHRLTRPLRTLAAGPARRCFRLDALITHSLRESCRRRSKSDPPCRSNIAPGMDADRVT